MLFIKKIFWEIIIYLSKKIPKKLLIEKLTKDRQRLAEILRSQKESKEKLEQTIKQLEELTNG